MENCCLKSITFYETLMSGAHEGAALYCKECTGRLVYHNGTWMKEEAR